MSLFFYRGLTTALCLVWSLAPAFGEELRPYSLPSQRSVPQQSQPERMLSFPGQHTEITQPPDDFRRRIEELAPDERLQLESGIRERLRQAVRAGRMEEARYYENLCSILAEMDR